MVQSVGKIVISLILAVSFQISENFCQTIRFQRLTVEYGLSNNNVNTLIQDKTGFIWFGTEDGLNRFDGYTFKTYRHDPSDTNSLSGNVVWSLIEDREGNIWVGTADGILNKYDPVSEKFSYWTFVNSNNTPTSITSLFIDSKDNFWIGTRTKGIFKWNPSTNEYINYNRIRSDSSTLSHPSVRAIAEDSEGNIIIGTYYGLNKFDPDLPFTGFKRFFQDDKKSNSLINDQIYSLSTSATNPDIIWIGTPAGLSRFNSEEESFKNIEIPNPDRIQFGSGASTVIEDFENDEPILWTDTYGGLVRINLTTGKAYRFINEETNPASLIDNRINKIIKDKSGVIWIATANGVSSLSTKSMKFNSPFNQTYLSFLNSSRNKNNLKAIHKNNTNVWLGFANGIIKLHQPANTNEYLKVDEFNNFNVWSLVESKNQSLFIGTFGQGLIEYDLNLFRQKEWILKFPKLNTRTVSFVKSLLIDSRNNLWVGYWGSGLGRINLESGKYRLWITQPSDPNAISHADVWSIVEDNYGRIWIGTQGGGINLFEDISDGIFHHWMHNKDGKNYLSGNNVNTICEAKKLRSLSDSETVLWIGTNDGLNRFKIINGNSENIYDVHIENEIYTRDDGLSNNSVNSIIEDSSGNLWLGTSSGISFFDVEKKTFINFSTEDGINGTLMNIGSAAMLETGTILMGSSDGLNIFDPEKITLSDFVPNLVITDFQLFNRSVEIGDDSPLNQSISSTDRLVLSQAQDVFSFEFAALDFNSSRSIEYAYKMEGFDKEWIYSGKRRFVTYTNLDPGKYTFKVKSTNADGIWIENITSLDIIMTPPWWRSTWAYFSYGILILLGLFGIRKFELSRAKLRNELKLREIEVRNKSELEEVKSRFFANLSHEFRTPLMLIKGPLEQLKKEKTDKNLCDHIDLIERNSNRLKELIDQLLELSQLEKAVIPLKASRTNLAASLKGMVSSFQALAERNKINLKYESYLNSETCWIDTDKFEKIINNLLSNAFKFTPQGGNVSVTLKSFSTDGKQFAEIIISDSGVGISNDKIDKIFDRFFQVDNSDQRSFGGSGIGLALVKEFVDLHKWKIFVESTPGDGTQFKILIPMWDDYLDDDEKVYAESVETANYPDINTTELKLLNHKTNAKQNTQLNEISNSKPLLLIVDDSEDVRKYLSGLLENDYKVATAENGEIGIKVAAEKNPDLIISDVMMPSMDGMEFCNQIKSNWMTSDIPVILLTAKASTKSKLEGLEIGADDYLTKPFDSRELFTRIKNLLDQRKRLRDKYNKNFGSLTDAEKLNSSDNEFFKKVLDLLEKNIDKYNFGVEQLAKELFVSRTQLHRKFLSITGRAPGEFIRIFRLERSAKLLLQGKLSVTQVAYEIGFSSPAQFTRAFTKQFNCLPSEFPNHNKKLN